MQAFPLEADWGVPSTLLNSAATWQGVVWWTVAGRTVPEEDAEDKYKFFNKMSMFWNRGSGT